MCGGYEVLLYEDDGDAIKKVKALTEHFDYSPEMKMVHRWQHTDEQWNHMIADELAAGRPIYYSSRSTKYDGHAIVGIEPLKQKIE